MNGTDEIFMRAVALGCRPFWFNGMVGWAWHCGCDNNQHGHDSQCSTISKSRSTLLEESARMPV